MAAPADILVVAAHPDDAEFGASGTVARWIREKKEVVYVVCTSGEKGTADRTMNPVRLATIRESEQEAAAKVLGVREVVFLRLPDQGLEDTPEFRKMIVRQIRTYRPATVVTSDPYRRYVWHRDHRIVGQVTLDAVFPFARDHLAYPDFLEEGLEPHKVREMFFFGSDDVNYRSDITETFDLKVAALRCHKSQVKELGVSDLETWLRGWSCSMAEGTECELAETFHRVEIK
ncbi:MAG TPA: PIG-L deacetylase family protein [Thermodesulfovibrionales bacterium]|nr:PIG-L deacetylase family protein [Thermodesulfovibrionales bacterium]